MDSFGDRPIKAVIVGAGHRGMLYSSYALEHPDELQIVGVVDPDPVRRARAIAGYGFGEDHGYEDLDALFASGFCADVAINGTMDNLHVPTTLRLLKAGYHVLLEKPIGISEEETLQLLEASRQGGKLVMICHVLRYAPFYAEIRKRVAEGQIGDILTIRLSENVSYHHMAAAFVRGKWGRESAYGSTMLMQKCCHDLDLMAWFKSGIPPVRVSSFGGRMFFREEKAPALAGTRCLVDCPIEEQCDYSARKHYIEMGRWEMYAWHGIEHLGEHLTQEQKLESLRTDNPFGRCVWKCDNDVVDHQSVIVEFADGCTGAHQLSSNSCRPFRSIHLVGTEGEIEGVLEDGAFVVRKRDVQAASAYSEEKVELQVKREMHGGGDLRLVGDFLRTLRGEAPSLSATTLEDSIWGHRIGFAADRARLNQNVVEF